MSDASLALGRLELEQDLKTNIGKITAHALVFAWCVILIGLWIWTHDLVASGVLACIFGWYIVTKIEEHLWAVTLATVLGLIVYFLNWI